MVRSRLKASFEKLSARHFAAIARRSAAVDHQRDVISLIPLPRCRITLGFTNVGGALPLPAKSLPALLASAAQRNGAGTLERVAKEGRWAKDARVAFAGALHTRKRFPKLHRLPILGDKYPQTISTV